MADFLKDAAKEFQSRTGVVEIEGLRKALTKAQYYPLQHLLDLPRLFPPFRTFGEYLTAQRIRLRYAMTRAQFDRAAQAASQAAAQLEAETGQKLVRVWEESRFDTVAQNALATGLAIASAGAAAGTAILPGIGTLVGAVGGFVIGLVAGLLPFAKQEALDKFSRLIEQLKPVERYMVLASLRRWSDEARDRMHEPRFPAWRIGDEGGILRLHTISQGEDVLVLFFLEALLRKDCFVPDDDPRMRAYAAALVASYTDDDTTLVSMPFAARLAAGEGGQWLARVVTENAAEKASRIRSSALALGLPDYGSRLITPAVETALKAAGYL